MLLDTNTEPRLNMDPWKGEEQGKFWRGKDYKLKYMLTSDAAT